MAAAESHVARSQRKVSTRAGAGWERELPRPIVKGGEGLQYYGVREGECSQAACRVSFVKGAYVRQMVGERGDEVFGQDGHALLGSHPVAHGDSAEKQGDVLDAQAQAFHQG